MQGLSYKNLIFLIIAFVLFYQIGIIFAEIKTIIDFHIHTTIKISICGDNIKDDNEVCDGTDLAGKTCQDFNYPLGVLKCSPACDEFDTSGCYTTTTTTLTFPGGGGGGYVAPAETRINFTGKAYPKSTVTLLKDAQVAATVMAGSDANFTLSLSGISAGNYIFSIYSEDKYGNRSSLLTFPVGVTFGVITNVSGVFIAPTIEVDKEEVKRGDSIAIFGQSLSNANITIQVSSDEEIFVNTESDSDGVYLYNFGTEVLDYGDHFTKSKAAKENEISSFSQAVSFLVGTRNVIKEVQKCGKADLNCDGKVNLVDFSIAAYWYKKVLSAEFAKIEQERLNGDGKIDLVDFSIMAYYWTG
ncbi:MAG: hypothetical protein PHG13_00075 [Candidatus Pacebacteria bacterium]|nr:hypothetical protein [Candidatus Paceibacterota bacterium]MDD5721678.1 hypothetical protein [Candidatus Paceibacterota bacterium]